MFSYHEVFKHPAKVAAQLELIEAEGQLDEKDAELRHNVFKSAIERIPFEEDDDFPSAAPTQVTHVYCLLSASILLIIYVQFHVDA